MKYQRFTYEQVTMIKGLERSSSRLASPYLAWHVWFSNWFPGGGGSNYPSPLYFLIVTFDTLLESPLGSTSMICKKMANFQKSKYLLRNLVIKQQRIAQIATNYTCLKSPWLSELKYAKTFANFLNLNFYSRKTKMWKFPLKAPVQKSV